MLWFIAGLIFLLMGIFYKKKKGDFGKRTVINGEITQIFEKEHYVNIRYSYPEGNEAIVAMCSDIDADFSKLKVGTKVFVVIDKANPSSPIIARYNTAGKDRTIEGSTKAAFIAAGMCFIAGIISLIGG